MGKYVCSNCKSDLEEHRFMLCKECGTIYYIEECKEDITKENLIYYIHCALQSNYKKEREKLKIILKLLEDYTDNEEEILKVRDNLSLILNNEINSNTLESLISGMLALLVVKDDEYLFFDTLSAYLGRITEKEDAEANKLLLRVLGIQASVVDEIPIYLKKQQTELKEKQGLHDMWQYILKITGSIFLMFYLMLLLGYDNRVVQNNYAILVLICGTLISMGVIIVGELKGRKAKREVAEILYLDEILGEIPDLTEYIKEARVKGKEIRDRIFNGYEDSIAKVQEDYEMFNISLVDIIHK